MSDAAQCEAPPTIDFRIALIGTLLPHNLKVAECLSRKCDNDQIVAELRVNRQRARELVQEVFTKLRIDSIVPIHDQRDYAGRLY